MNARRDWQGGDTAGLYIGLMSGTSLDGVDAVLAEFTTPPATVLATHYQDYPSALKEELLSLQNDGADTLSRAASLGNRLAHLYHQAVASVLEKAGIDASAVRAIGCHGQTVRHNPAQGYTIQLGNPALLAELSGIRVVCDFRSRDIAAGGQGAPLAPAFHDAAFRSADRHRLVLNIGGMANVTNLRPGAETTGFDTGPGNVLMDAWVRENQGWPYDAGGSWAAGGRPLRPLLEALLAHPYFDRAPPKSCGREEFNLRWLQSHLRGDESGHDVQATLLELTVLSVVTAVERWCGRPDEIIVCGGGAHNGALLQGLRGRLSAARVYTSSELGIGPDWVEALAFAWLARQTCLGLAGNLPTVTGARGPRILGAIYPGK